jgi:hypothetical protein
MPIIIPDDSGDFPPIIKKKSKKTESNIIDSFFNEHPNIKKFILGPSNEETDTEIGKVDPILAAKRKQLGVTGLSGPGLAQVPGISKLADITSHAIDPSDKPFYTGLRPLAGGIAKAAINTLGTVDPRAAYFKDSIPNVEPIEPIEPIEATPKPQLALPAYKEPLMLPADRRVGNLPLPQGMSERRMSELMGNFGGTSNDVKPFIAKGAEVPTKPSFIAGPAGVAKNEPYTIDIGPVQKPSIGNMQEGTVLPQEYGQVTSIPPDLAARRVPSIGHVETPTEKIQPKFNYLSGKAEKILAPEQPSGNFYQSGNARPGESQLPSATKIQDVGPLEQSQLDAASNPNRNIGANVKTITRPEGIPEGMVEAPPIESNLSPKEAIQRWGYGRNAGRFSAQQIKDQFSELADKPELISEFQAGSRSGQLKDVGKYFDDRFKKLVDAGVLNPEDYKQNYLKQLWEDKPEVVDAVFNKGGVGREPGLSKESVFKSYKSGIKAGLTPKFNNIADIAGEFEKEFTNAMKDKELYDYLSTKGVKLGNKSISDPSTWKQIAKLDPEAQKMVANYFSKSPESLHNIANVVSGTKNLALTQGLPYRTGQVSAHGFNVLQSDIMAQGFKKGLSDFFKGSINPETDLAYVKQNSSMIKKLIENGMNWTDIEDHSALSSDKVSSLIDKIPGAGQANILRRKMFEDPLFKVHLPATKLRIALDRFQQLVPKVGENEALKGAASYANDFAGGVDKTFRNKTYQDIARIGLLAPDWLESRANIAIKGLTGKEGYVKPLIRGAGLASLPVVSGVAAKGVTGYLNSKPSESTGIDIGEVGNKTRNLEPLGTSIEPHRAAIQLGTQLSQGNLQFPFRYAGNKLSPPIQTLMYLKDNVDPYGNPISGKDRFGRPISSGQSLANISQELARPITPNIIQSIIDYYKNRAEPEEIASKGLGLPVTYTSKAKGKKTSSGLAKLK